MGDEVEKTKEEIAREIATQTQQADELAQLEEMLKRNIVEWQLEKVTYRVRKPTYKERQEIRQIKIKRHNELRADPNWKYEQHLIKEYEKKGISIAQMINRMLELTHQIEELELKLAELGNASEKDTKAILDLKIQISNLMIERNTISIEKNELLSESIESELLVLVNSYTCYLVLEKKDGENWIRVFNSYDDFMNSENDNLLRYAGHYLSLIIYQVGKENE